MNWLKKIFNKKVDERQEMDLLRVEHYSFWLMFWLLAIEIIVQGIILDGSDKILGEWIVFMATAVFSVAGFIRKGVWSFQAKKVPGVKSYFLYSVIAGAAGGVIGFFIMFRRSPDTPQAVLAGTFGMAAAVFAISFAAFCVLGSITKLREKKLEREAVEDDMEDDEEGV